jgi:hypothetical protein
VAALLNIYIKPFNVAVYGAKSIFEIYAGGPFINGTLLDSPQNHVGSFHHLTERNLIPEKSAICVARATETIRICIVYKVSDDYGVPFKFTGTLDKLTLTIDRRKLSAVDIESLKEATRNNRAAYCPWNTGVT